MAESKKSGAVMGEPGRKKFRHGSFTAFLFLFALLATLLFGGMEVGLLLAEYLAPDSLVGQFVGFFMLPLSLGVGMTVWYWTAFGAFLLRILPPLRRKRPITEADFRETFRGVISGMAKQVPPGCFLFVPVSTGISLLAGVAIGLIPSSAGLLRCIALTTLAGFVYGIMLWQLTKRGVIPIPEDV
jgi:hypothetical protein